MQDDAQSLLSERQAEIAAMVVSGKSSRQIAIELSLSPRTVQTHIAAIFNKLGVRSRVELTAALLGSGAGVSAILAAPRATKTNLPLQRASLLGRETEIADIAGMLGDSRLVTVTGSGGIGKTRIALAVANIFLRSTKAGVWFVELLPLADGSLVAAAIARVLNVQQSPGRPLIEVLQTHIKHKALLLVLDNCEHVVSDAAVVADILLRDCPHLRVLATSRELLRIAGERTYRLPSLPVPTAQDTLGLGAAEVSRYAAVQLFAERARANDHGFALSDDNAPIVAEICRRLDGIPLAIELAAARVKVLSVRALSTKLDQRFQILTSGDRTALPRHQTMRALIDWSYDLLSPPEQRLFERLSVFAGGCGLAAAATVYTDDGADELGVLALLSSLVDKSLVVADLACREPRYRLLESSRQYAHEKLVARGESAVVAHRHATAFVQLAEQLEREHDIAPNVEWFACVESEYENWRGALYWTLGAQGDIVLGQRLAGLMRPIWTRFAIAEGRRWLDAARELADERTPATVAANLELAAASVSYGFGEYAAALAASRRLIPLYRELGDAVRAARAQLIAGISLVNLRQFAEGKQLLQSTLEAARSLGLMRLAGLALEGGARACAMAGFQDEARVQFAQALEIYRGIGAERDAVTAAWNLAEAEFLAGHVEQAIQLSTAGLRTARHLGYTLFVMQGLTNLAAYLIARDLWDEARACAREALELAQEAQHCVGIAWALQHLAAIAILSNGFARPFSQTAVAVRLLGYVDRQIRALGVSREYIEQQEFDRVLIVLRDAIGGPELTAFTAEGATMTQDQAIESASSL